MSAQAAAKVQTSVTYDELPYESGAFPQTHPSHLHTVARLFGMTPPDFKTARVLELGSASGANLFPLAVQYPKASFVGIDFSKSQVKMANEQKQALKLNNIEFLEQDIMQFAPPSKEKFDYIIVHGVFSWVPEPVRKKILDICNDWLSPNGLAVISYNVLPGWNAVRSLREMMLYHTARFTNVAEKINQARGLLEFLNENVTSDRDGYRAMIAEEISKLKAVNNNSYFYHDHMETENTQFYLHEFARQARDNGLEYVGDTSVNNMFIGNMPLKAAQLLQTIQDDIVAQEQYMDFITNRRFRHSIVAKKGVKISRALQNPQIMEFHLTMNNMVQIEGTDMKKEVTFKLGEASFSTHDIIPSTLFSELHACRQQPIAAKELVERVQKKLGHTDAQAVTNMLIAHGIPLMLHGYVNLHGDTVHYIREVPKKPVSYPVARYQASKGWPRLTNAAHNAVQSDLTSNMLVSHMDGTRTVEDLAGVIADKARKGEITIDIDGTLLKDDDELRKAAQQAVDVMMPRLVKAAIIVG